MNASRTRQIDAQGANRAQGRQPYQPSTAIAPRACNRLVYKTQTLDWVLDRVSCCARRGAAERVPSQGIDRGCAPAYAQAITRPLTRAVKATLCPLPLTVWMGGLPAIFPHFLVDFVD